MYLSKPLDWLSWDGETQLLGGIGTWHHLENLGWKSKGKKTQTEPKCAFNHPSIKIPLSMQKICNESLAEERANNYPVCAYHPAKSISSEASPFWQLWIDTKYGLIPLHCGLEALIIIQYRVYKQFSETKKLAKNNLKLFVFQENLDECLKCMRSVSDNHAYMTKLHITFE